MIENNLDKNNKNNLFLDNITLVNKGILLFLLIISGNYIGNLFSCRIQDYFESSIFAKHSIAFMSLYFFVILAEPKLQEVNPIITLFLSIPLYFYFLILAKSEASVFLLTIVILIILMISHNYENYLKKKIKHNNFEFIYLKYVTIIKKVLIGFIIFITLIGFLVYLGMKKVEYKEKFNFKTFIFGQVVCKQNFLGSNYHTHVSKYSKIVSSLDLQSILLFIKYAFIKKK